MITLYTNQLDFDVPGTEPTIGLDEIIQGKMLTGEQINAVSRLLLQEMYCRKKYLLPGQDVLAIRANARLALETARIGQNEISLPFPNTKHTRVLATGLELLEQVSESGAPIGKPALPNNVKRLPYLLPNIKRIEPDPIHDQRRLLRVVLSGLIGEALKQPVALSGEAISQILQNFCHWLQETPTAEYLPPELEWGRNWSWIWRTNQKDQQIFFGRSTMTRSRQGRPFFQIYNSPLLNRDGKIVPLFMEKAPNFGRALKSIIPDWFNGDAANFEELEAFLHHLLGDEHQKFKLSEYLIQVLVPREPLLGVAMYSGFATIIGLVIDDVQLGVDLSLAHGLTVNTHKVLIRKRFEPKARLLLKEEEANCVVVIDK